jgi:hypothetical protein
LQTVATGLSVEVLLGEAIARFLDREAAVGVVHVVVDDQIVKLLRLARRRRQWQQQAKSGSMTEIAGSRT